MQSCSSSFSSPQNQDGAMLYWKRKRPLEQNKLGFDSAHHCLLALCPWTSYMFSILIYKIDIIVSLANMIVVSI